MASSSPPSSKRSSRGKPRDAALRIVLSAVLAAFFLVLTVAITTSIGLEGQARTQFLDALGWVSLVLLPMAALSVWASVRDVTGDIDFAAQGIRAMARDEAGGGSIPARTLDELGALSREFDRLRSHFIELVDRERAARRRAEDADREKTEFLTSVSHELRTPLNAVLGFTEVLRREIEGPLTPSQHEDLAIIHNAGTHLVALFNDVLDLSAAASGHLRIERAPVEVASIVRAVAAEARGQRGSRAIDIRVEIEPSLPTVFGDGTRLRQIVTNLVGNAMKFTERGEVAITVERDAGFVCISVRDTGPGIEPAHLQNLFEEFSQVGDEGLRRRGSGLGLAISRQLVELHHGTIEVKSTLGRGSTFRVRIPVAEGTA